jgi:rRNA biogenesis protein RRP5
MSHHLSLADIDAARGIAERALKAINFREEDEQYNVWVAFLNLEHDYGDNATLEAVFKRGVQSSKGKYLTLNLAEIYEKSGNITGAEEVFDKAVKKYNYSKKVWGAYQHFCLRNEKADQAKIILKRSMQSLSRHKHVEVLTKYALAEFDFGNVDRGRVVFEELLSSYPKRTDLQHVYVDKEIKMGYYPQARQLFDRMCASKLKSHNMKAIFKKYLQFEQKYGDDASADEVMQKARAYIAASAK